MAAYSKSEQNPIIETLIQSSPAATSTPNPIQQHEKQDETQDIAENTSLNNNMASQQNNQNQFIKVSMTASSQLNQTQK